jgi:hypothetical protein
MSGQKQSPISSPLPFTAFFEHLKVMTSNLAPEFKKIKNLIAFHLDIVKEMPGEIYLAVRICPARLKDPDGICRKSIPKMRRRLKELSCPMSGKGDSVRRIS